MKQYSKPLTSVSTVIFTPTLQMSAEKGDPNDKGGRDGGQLARPNIWNDAQDEWDAAAGGLWSSTI